MVVAFDIETLGLDAFQHQIVLIGMKVEGRIRQWKLWKEKDELNMIFKWLKTLEKIPTYETIIGYNNMKFDVPFVSTRLSVYGKWTSDLWELLYRDRKWLDLYQFLGNDYRRMDHWCVKLGIKRKHEDISGRDIPEHYDKERYKLIEQHNKDDLVSSEQLYLKLQERFPELLKV